MQNFNAEQLLRKAQPEKQGGPFCVLDLVICEKFHVDGLTKGKTFFNYRTFLPLTPGGRIRIRPLSVKVLGWSDPNSTKTFSDYCKSRPVSK